VFASPHAILSSKKAPISSIKRERKALVMLVKALLLVNPLYSQVHLLEK